MTLRDDAIEWLEDVGGELGEDYWREAEREDSHYFEDRFDTLQGVKIDFATYAMVDGCDACGYDDGYFDDDDELRCIACGEIQPL